MGLPMAGEALAQAHSSSVFQGHTRIASLLAQDRAGLVRTLQGLGPDVDVAEIRLDSIWPNVPDEDGAAEDLLAISDAAPVPLIATLRPRRQGGRFEGPETVRVGLLAAAGRAGFAAVDLEADVADTPGIIAGLRSDVELVLSHHQALTPTCDEGGRLLVSMQDKVAALDKLVFEAGSFADTLRALELARKHALRGGRPAISTLGTGGAPLRALLAVAGNRSTYGHAPGLLPAVPGQPALQDAQDLWNHWGLGKGDLDALATAPSRWLAVIGTPVLHSLSPCLHNAALRQAGRAERFAAMEVPASAAALRLTCMVAKRIGLVGASVTAPHKVDAFRIGRPDAVAQQVRAANCLRFTGEEPEATNTDATALRRLLESQVDANSPAVVLGAGGAARAAIWALQQLGAVVRFTSRDPKRAEAVVRDLGAKWTPWQERGELAGQCWVHAASSEANAVSPIPAHQLRGAPVVVELGYKDGPTSFQKEAAAAGCPVIDGRTILVEQAVDAFRFWTGMEPDRKSMEQALVTP